MKFIEFLITNLTTIFVRLNKTNDLTKALLLRIALAKTNLTNYAYRTTQYESEKELFAN